MARFGAVGALGALPGAIRGAPNVDGTHAGSGAGGGTRETTPPRTAPPGAALISRAFSLQHGSLIERAFAGSVSARCDATAEQLAELKRAYGPDSGYPYPSKRGAYSSWCKNDLFRQNACP